MTPRFINIHTHSDAHEAEALAVRSFHQREFDLLSPERLEACSLGLHPWFLDAGRLEADFATLERLAASPAVFAIGEAGLDRAISVPMDLQESAFLQQVELAERLQKPLILHCVRAHERMAHLKKTLRPRQNWIFHGFDKHPQTARTLLDAGCFLSFGAALFRQNSHAANALRATPAERFFLETDDKNLSIKDVYERCADIRNMGLLDLELRLRANFIAVQSHGTA